MARKVERLPETIAERQRIARMKGVEQERLEASRALKRSNHMPQISRDSEIRSIYSSRQMLDADRIARRVVAKADMTRPLSQQEYYLSKIAREEIKQGIPEE